MDICRFLGIFIFIKQIKMLPTQQAIPFSNYSDLYDLIVPHDNVLRRINDLVDFSFIQKNLWINTAMTMAAWLKVL